MVTSIEKTQATIAKAREIMESFDQTPAMTIGFDKESYTLTSDQMVALAGALYLADCEISYMQHMTNAVKPISI